ncbi:MAG: tetratricopeptide repeat protein [Candidatus Omnitrophica bacterium]|nr:tetratricopeptide repeat protein [Candidatus Omnitrophota bacterium]
MRNVFIKIIDTFIHLVIVCAIISVPLYYVIGKGEGYFFSIYDIYKEVLVQSIGVILFGLYSLRLSIAERLTTRKIIIFLPLALFMAMMLLSFSQMLNPYEGFVFLKRWISYYLIIFVLANYCTSKEHVIYYMNWIVGLGTVLAIYGTLQIFNIDFPFLVQNFKGNATDGNPNFTGEYMSMIFPMVFWLAVSYAGSKRSILYIILSVITGFFILINKTKAVWIGLTMSTIMIAGYIIIAHMTGILRFAVTDRQKQLFKTVVIIFASICIFIMLISALTFIPALQKANKFVDLYNVQVKGFFGEFRQFAPGVKVFTPADEIDESIINVGDTTMQRILIWQNTLKMVKEHLWLGVGLGNFKINYQPYRTRKEQLSTGPDVFVRRTHNDWLQTLAELGIFGFLFFLMIQGGLYWMGHQLLVRSNNFQGQSLTIGFMMSFGAVFFTAIYGFPLQSPNPCFTVWTLVGLFAAFHWIRWYKEDLRSVTPLRSRLHALIPGKLNGNGKGDDRVSANTKKVSRSKKKKMRDLQDIDPDAGLWVFSPLVHMVLIPFFIASFIFGIVSHYWIWKPAHAFYNRQFGQALQRMGRHDKARILFEKSVKDEPLAWETLFLLANEYSAMNQHVDAKREHTKSLELNPYHAKGHYNLANTLNKLGEFDEALHHYQLAVEYDDMLYQAYLNLGAMYFQRREFDKCIEFYEMSLKANPEFFSAYYNLAYALCSIGRVSDAIPYLQKANELEPGNPKVKELEDRIRQVVQEHNARQVQQQNSVQPE